MMRRRRTLSGRSPTPAVAALAAAGLIAATLTWAPPASAEERQSIFIGDATEKSKVVKFPRIEGRDPYQPLRANQYSYGNCRAGNDTGGVGPHYIVSHKITVRRSSEYGHITRFKFTWEYDEATNPNVLLLQLYKPPPPDFVPSEEDPANDGSELIAAGGDYGFGELEINDLGNTKVDEDDRAPSEYWLCIGNTKFDNTDGYTLQIVVDSIPLPSFDVRREELGSVGTFEFDDGDVPDDFGADPFSGFDADQDTLAVQPETVATPGPDGPMRTETLALVAKRASQFVAGDGFRTASTIATLLIVVAGVVIVGMRIRRDRV